MGVTLGTAVTKDNYAEYIKALQDKANKTQDVSQQDLQPLETFLGMSTDSNGHVGPSGGDQTQTASAAGISTDQLLKLQSDVSNMDMIVGMSAGTFKDQSGSAASAQSKTDMTNKQWQSEIEDLINGASSFSASDAKGGESADNVNIVSGTGSATTGSRSYPAGTPLETALKAPGAKVTFNNDNGLWTVSTAAQGVQAFAPDGKVLGAVPSSGLKVNITNPANPSTGYVTIDGQGNMTASSASSGQFADLTVTGDGHGGYATGNTAGVSASGGTSTFPPGSDAAKFAADPANGTNVSDPSKYKYDVASGTMAIQGKDSFWHVFDGTGKSVGIIGQENHSLQVPANGGHPATVVTTDSVGNFAFDVNGNVANLPQSILSQKDSSGKFTNQLAATVSGQNGETNVNKLTDPENGLNLVSYVKDGQKYKAIFDGQGKLLIDGPYDKALAIQDSTKKNDTDHKWLNWAAGSETGHWDASAGDGSTQKTVKGTGDGNFDVE